MDLSEYESRRKVQNREAQRRYRQKQKERNGNGGSSSQSTAASLNAETMSAADTHASLDGDFTDFFQNSALYLANYTQGGSSGEFDDSVAGTYPGYPLDNYPEVSSPSPSHTGGRSRKKSKSDELPRSHGLMLEKAERMVKDLSQLYEFGVEMQLMSTDKELHSSLNHVETRFRKSIHKAAENA